MRIRDEGERKEIEQGEDRRTQIVSVLARGTKILIAKKACRQSRKMTLSTR